MSQVKSSGVKAFCFKILGRTVYRRLVLISRDVNDPVLESPAPEASIQVGRLTSDEVEEYAQCFKADSSDIRRRLQNGHTCYVARHESNLIHACWTAAGHAWIQYLHTEIHLPPGVVYIYEAHTLPAWRSKGVSHARYRVMMRDLKADRYKQCWAAVHPENTNALRIFLNMQYKRIGLIGFYGIGSFRRQFFHLDPHSGVSMLGEMTAQ